MRKFAFNYTKFIGLILVLANIISLVALGLNIYYIISPPPFENVIKFIIFGALSLVLVLFSISLFASKYVIKGKKLTLHIGFFKIKYAVDDIVQIIFFEKHNHLIVYFKDATLTTILINKKHYNDFVESLKNENPLIIYSSTQEEE